MNISRLPIAALLAVILLTGCADQRTNVSDHKPAAANAEEPDEQTPPTAASNEAFRVFEPAEGSVVGKSFTVKGQARVFEATFGYSFEDGHNVLAEGHVTADQGAPAWGDFEFTVTLAAAPTNTTGVLTIYESSAKDGSHIHELHLAYAFEDGLVSMED
ncbi:Gmad2 immunoglobulin-like domain-containing protein [Paenibacillus silvisoli]|uniref:Gmad2 immunoglobulin-like domain-containing protein n=1 Tax=Paenibacillus silvisoli TaxID=3110539 RepID=UPI0028051094|nr:Gmad2 immunoglobulin-like domain-containing protein [Paenibacillus silvisoli]